MEHQRLRPALKKVLLELNNCVLKRRVFDEFMSLNSAHGLDFFRVAITALQNDLYAGAHRAFDRHDDATSIWFIRNIAEELFLKALSEANVTLERLEELSEKLKPIRDRVHFHSDRRDLENPSSPWEDADISGNEFIELTENAHEVLRIMNLELTGIDSDIPDYNGDDIGNIIRAYKKLHPNAPLSI